MCTGASPSSPSRGSGLGPNGGCKSTHSLPPAVVAHLRAQVGFPVAPVNAAAAPRPLLMEGRNQMSQKPRSGRLPQRSTLALHRGFVERIETVAEFEHMPPAEWMRQMFRNALDAARKRQQRAGS